MTAVEVTLGAQVRVLVVVAVERPTPRCVRISLAGDHFDGLVSGAPDDHVTVYFPAVHGADPAVPGLPGGGRPIGRDYTARVVGGVLQFDLVLHGGGRASSWAAGARVGERLLVAGASRPVMAPDHASHRVLAGDETALPAIRELLAHWPDDVVADVFVEVAGLEDMQHLATAAAATVCWVTRGGQAPGTPLVEVVRQAALRLGDTSVWVAAEVSTTRALYSYFVDERGLPPDRVSAHGYWSRGSVRARAGRALI